ncbi:MAG: hypothetical protein J2P37_14520 [Ktedonobacteraceae bacterium]|nr:hypothetical protein [Ktedonobacteraceae bacterium]
MEALLGSMPPCPKIVHGQQELTPEQQAYLRHFAQVRTASVLSTAAIDEAETEAHVRSAYCAAGLEPPQVHWFDSPMSVVVDSEQKDIVSNTDNVMGGVRESMESQIRDRVGNKVWNQVWDCVMESMWERVIERVGDNIQRSVMNLLETSWKWDKTRWEWDNVWTYAGASVTAYSNALWLAVGRFFHEAFEENHLLHFARFNEMVSGYHLGSNEAWLVRKPIRLEQEEQGRWHSVSGMCLQYRDGWGFSAWHGVRVPEKLILHPDQLTKEDWLWEGNLEVRRAMQERLGPDRFMELVGATCIDQGRRGSLMEVDLGYDPERVAHYVQVRDASTQRQYFLRVPPSIQRADEAVAWTFGLDELDYQPVQET